MKWAEARRASQAHRRVVDRTSLWAYGQRAMAKPIGVGKDGTLFINFLRPVVRWLLRVLGKA